LKGNKKTTNIFEGSNTNFGDGQQPDGQQPESQEFFCA